MINGVGRKRQFNYSEPIGYGYIIIPTGVDRDTYVATCYGRERLSVLGENGQGFIKNCYISRDALRDINFPPDSDTLGQMVAYIVNSFSNVPIIVGVVSKESETQLLEEGEFRLEKTYNNSNVSVTGKAKTGDLIIDVQNNDGKGALILNVSGKNGSAFKINCKGDATIYSDDTVNLETTGEANIKSVDATDKTKFTNVKVTNGKFEINDGTESILLGNKTVTQLNKESAILKAITTILNGAPVVTTAVGQPDGLYVALKAAIAGKTHGDFSEVKSEISFTD